MEEKDLCSICLDDLPDDPARLPDCIHKFHMDCIRNWSGCKSVCPLCKAPFSEILFKGATLKVEVVPAFTDGLEFINDSDLEEEEKEEEESDHEDDEYCAICGVLVATADDLGESVICSQRYCSAQAHVFCLGTSTAEEWYCFACDARRQARLVREARAAERRRESALRLNAVRGARAQSSRSQVSSSSAYAPATATASIPSQISQILTAQAARQISTASSSSSSTSSSRFSLPSGAAVPATSTASSSSSSQSPFASRNTLVPTGEPGSIFSFPSSSSSVKRPLPMDVDSFLSRLQRPRHSPSSIPNPSVNPIRSTSASIVGVKVENRGFKAGLSEAPVADDKPTQPIQAGFKRPSRRAGIRRGVAPSIPTSPVSSSSPLFTPAPAPYPPPIPSFNKQIFRPVVRGNSSRSN